MTTPIKRIQAQLKESGVAINVDEPSVPERNRYHTLCKELQDFEGDAKDYIKLQKKVEAARKEYALVFHRWFALQYPHLLYERGEDKVFWNYDVTEGVYVEMGRAEVRGALMRELAKEEMIVHMTEAYCRDCLARYRGEFPDRARAYEDFDSDDDWFHANNGWVHIDTLEFQSHTPVRTSRRKSAVLYDKDATCPRYDLFLDEDCRLKKDAVRVIDQFSGLLLTHDIRQQKMLVLEGKAGSGKSTLLETWSYVLGDMVSQNSLTDFSGDKHRFIGSSLVGKTLCWCDEVEVKRSEMSSSLEKKVTNSTLEIERKGIDGTRYAPNYLKFVLTANSLPSSSEVGIYRRLIVIPFTRSFYDEGTVDNELLQKLQNESSGILNRMLEGIHDLRKMRAFTLIEGHAERIEQYKIVSNTVAGFLDEYFEPVLEWNNKEYAIPTNHLREAYVKYLGTTKFVPTPQRFGQMLKEQPTERFRCVEPYKATGGERKWKGMRLRDEYEWSDGCIVTKSGLETREIRPEDVDW